MADCILCSTKLSKGSTTASKEESVLQACRKEGHMFLLLAMRITSVSPPAVISSGTLRVHHKSQGTDCVCAGVNENLVPVEPLVVGIEAPEPSGTLSLYLRHH